METRKPLGKKHHCPKCKGSVMNMVSYQDGRTEVICRKCKIVMLGLRPRQEVNPVVEKVIRDTTELKVGS